VRARWTFVGCAVAAVAWPSPIEAQADADVSVPFADSVAIVAASIHALTESGLLQQDQVVFLRDGAVTIHDEFLVALRRIFPELRPYPTDTGIHLCPDGEPARFPGSRCPTLDGGFAVRMNDISDSEEADISVRVGVTTGSGGRVYAGLFDREDGAFVVRRFELIMIT
jgi:hypothetical protein